MSHDIDIVSELLPTPVVKVIVKSPIPGLVFEKEVVGDILEGLVRGSLQIIIGFLKFCKESIPQRRIHSHRLEGLQKVNFLLGANFVSSGILPSSDYLVAELFDMQEVDRNVVVVSAIGDVLGGDDLKV